MLEENIGPLTKAMNHGGSFSLDINPQSLMRILSVVECLCIKEESIICFLCCLGMDVLVEIYQKREIKCDLSPWTFVQAA